MQGRSGVTTGGQEVFLDFIEHDLRPAIAQRLAVDPQRQALFGHSLGGLLTLHALYTRPHLFQTWLAADPSLWWDGGSILREEQAFLAGVQAAGNRLRTPLRLLIERSGGSRRTARAERPAAGAGAAPAPLPAEVLDSARRLARVEGMQVAYHRFANESHGSMVAPSIRDGLAFLLGAAPEHLDVL
jgi:predicted alpha/beta superfamily hydrolase